MWAALTTFSTYWTKVQLQMLLSDPHDLIIVVESHSSGPLYNTATLASLRSVALEPLVEFGPARVTIGWITSCNSLTLNLKRK